MKVRTIGTTLLLVTGLLVLPGSTSAAMAGTTAAGTTPGAAAACNSQLIGNGGLESGTTPWTATSGVVGSFSGQPAHGGTRDAWLDGYGSRRTCTLTPVVTHHARRP